MNDRILGKSALFEATNLIATSLIEDGWERVEVKTRDEWWAYDEWSMRSIRENWGFEVFILFCLNTKSKSAVRIADGFNGGCPDFAFASTRRLTADPFLSEETFAFAGITAPRRSKIREFVIAVDALRNPRT